jgi:hypothetical protein
MAKFIEAYINGKLTAVNIDNIATITRVSELETEFELLTRNKENEPLKFKALKNYAEFRLILNNEDRLVFDFVVNTH